MSLIKIAAVSIFALFHAICVKADFVYNSEDAENGSTEYVYRLDESGKFLTNHLQYRYTYDEQGRTMVKQALYWNPGMKFWEPYYQMRYSYDAIGHGFAMEYASWDKKSGSYSTAMEKVQYVMDSANQLVCYQGYKWDKQAQEWNLVQNFSNLAFEGKLYAQR